MWLDHHKESSGLYPTSSSEVKEATSSTPQSVLTVAEAASSTPESVLAVVGAASSTPEKGTSSSNSVLEAHKSTTVSPLDRLTSVIQVQQTQEFFLKNLIAYKMLVMLSLQ